MCIIRFDCLIAFYLFISLVCKASFLIVKNIGFWEELSDVNKSLCRNIFLLRSQLCTSPLVRLPPQLTLFTSPTTFQRPGMCAVDNFQHFRLCSLCWIAFSPIQCWIAGQDKREIMVAISDHIYVIRVCISKKKERESNAIE